MYYFSLFLILFSLFCLHQLGMATDAKCSSNSSSYEVPERIYNETFSNPYSDKYRIQTKNLLFRDALLAELKKNVQKPQLFVEIYSSEFNDSHEKKGYSAFLISSDPKKLAVPSGVNIKYYTASEEKLEAAESLLVDNINNTVKREPNMYPFGPTFIFVHYVTEDKYLSLTTFGNIDPMYKYDKDHGTTLSNLNRHNLMCWLSYLTKGDLQFFDYTDYTDLNEVEYSIIRNLEEIDSDGFPRSLWYDKRLLEAYERGKEKTE